LSIAPCCPHPKGKTSSQPKSKQSNTALPQIELGSDSEGEGSKSLVDSSSVASSNVSTATLDSVTEFKASLLKSTALGGQDGKYLVDDQIDKFQISGFKIPMELIDPLSGRGPSAATKNDDKCENMQEALPIKEKSKPNSKQPSSPCKKQFPIQSLICFPILVTLQQQQNLVQRECGINYLLKVQTTCIWEIIRGQNNNKKRGRRPMSLLLV